VIYGARTLAVMLLLVLLGVYCTPFIELMGTIVL